MGNISSQIKGKKILVIGLGVSGKSAVSFLIDRGAWVTAVDRNKSIVAEDSQVAELCKRGLAVENEEVMKSAEGFDFVVASPGVPHTHPCYSSAVKSGIKVLGEIELACREINQPCIGVTGTNGKTTVTLLVDHVLNSVGISSQALGNVGVPLTSAVRASCDSSEEVLVIELSSFQLETLESAFLDSAMLLNITPDHLDRYASMEEYAAAKISIGRRLKKGGVFFVEEKCYDDYSELFSGMDVLLYGYSEKCAISTDLKDVYRKGKIEFALPDHLKGKKSHDVENMMAAFALCAERGVSGSQFIHAYSTFVKPSHRIEFIRTLSGVSFYDDSKGTNIDAVIRAVQGFDGRVILIAGGVDKGFPYTSWSKEFDGKVKAICAIGQAKERIKRDLENAISVALFSDLQEAVIAAAKMAQEGDTVLLSPGCSSFDMFKDYAHRGREFQRIVNSIVSLR